MGRRSRSMALRVALVVAVVTAGCGSDAVPVWDPSPGGETLTPAPIPEGTGTADGDRRQLAPGLTADGLADTLELMAAHRSVLRNTSWTLTVTHVQRYGTGTVRLRERRTITSTLDGSYRRVHRIEGVASEARTRVEEWSNGSVRLVRAERGETVSYRRFPVEGTTDGPRPSLVLDEDVAVQAEHQRLIAILLDTEDLRVDRLDRPHRESDRQQYQLRATKFEDDMFVTRDGLAVRLTEVEVLFVVNDRGVVHSARFAYMGRADGRELHVVERLRYTELGTATVREPSWIGTAINETSGVG